MSHSIVILLEVLLAKLWVTCCHLCPCWDNSNDKTSAIYKHAVADLLFQKFSLYHVQRAKTCVFNQVELAFERVQVHFDSLAAEMTCLVCVRSQSSLQSQEIVSELVYSFLIPEIEKIRVRQRGWLDFFFLIRDWRNVHLKFRFTWSCVSSSAPEATCPFAGGSEHN